MDVSITQSGNIKHFLLNGCVVNSNATPPNLFAIDDQIMLATSTGQSIRCPVEGISFRSRSAGGVKVFDTGSSERVVSVAWIAEQEDEEQVAEAE